ncbi:MAG: carbohydrate ABC transporter substrate-binding protein [Oscillospiraceae bacterium]|nr:carbohydrate ABC transporter substrate-binding protein [Oscillospiraceae bacterium]
MKKMKLMLAALAAISMAFAATACGKEESSEGRTKAEDDVKIDVAQVEEIMHDLEDYQSAQDVSGEDKTVCWMAVYDLNPKNNQDRSVALTLFEDVYGGKIKYIATTSDSKFDDLANHFNSGDQIDIFPYEWDAVPNGVTKGMYDPLDNYVDLSDPIWNDMRDYAETYKYDGHYYVVPYSVSDPLAITYSRTLMQEEGLKDPYELYKKGEWNWNTFLDMMKQFVSNADEGEQRFGARGWFGQAIVQSTGDTVIHYDGNQFSNNIMSASIERAELLQEQISKLGLYDGTWYSHFPEDGSTLFYGMAPWSLGESNAMNPDGDIFIVPFPKDPESDTYYLNMNYGASMLVRNSKQGHAVGAYITCCRLEQVVDQYRQAAKEKALIQETNAQGKVTNYITEEQYDFMQTWYDPSNIKCVFDFGYGMGNLMYNETYDYNTRGVMNNVADALLVGYEGTPDTWAEIRSQWSSVVDTVVSDYNKKLQ